MIRTLACLLVGLICGLTSRAQLSATVRFADLDVGESQQITLADGRQVTLRLVSLEEHRDEILEAVRSTRVHVELGGIPITLHSAMYHLPVTVVDAGVQIDCPITQGHVSRSRGNNRWSLQKAARFRLWPADSSLHPGQGRGRRASADRTPHRSA